MRRRSVSSSLFPLCVLLLAGASPARATTYHFSTRILLRTALLIIGITAATPTADAQVTDPAFNPGANGPVFAIATQADGKVLIGGYFTAVGGGTGTVSRKNIARLHADGSVDLAFDPGANNQVYAIAVQSDGRILVGGRFTGLGGGTGATTRLAIGRLNEDGSVDSGFNPGASNGAYVTEVVALAVEPDGQILVGGRFTALGGGTGTTARLNIGRLDATGAVDESFAPGALGDPSGPVVNSIAVEPDGDVILGGRFSGLGGGTGATPRLNLGRVSSTGVVDVGFDPGVSGVGVFGVVAQPDGRILVAGQFTGIGGGSGTTPRSNLARLETDGTVDQAFAPGLASTAIEAVALQADGSLIVALTGGAHPRLRRLAPADGSSDGSLNTFIAGYVYALALDSDGHLLAGGDFISFGSPRQNIARLLNPTKAEQSVDVSADGSTITWLRGGGLPEVSAVDFRISTDGTTFTSIGAGTRVAGGWELTGLGLGPSPAGVIQARGVHSTGLRVGSTSQTTVTVPVPGSNIVVNGGFDSGLSNWLQFALPDTGGIVTTVTDGVFEFYRTGTQAVVFQQTGMPLPAFAPVRATFDLGNSDSVRKRISILVHDSNFADLSVCTFWLPPSTAPQTYTMRTHTTQAWSNLTVSFYAANANAAGNTTGFYRLDNVAVQYAPANSVTETMCVDPTAPAPPGGAAEANLLVNGDFASGTVAPGWSTFGQIQAQVTSGVLEFIKLAGTPAGVLLQPTGQAMTAGQLLTATFDLGNSSPVRKRVTVILHDLDFSDLSACTFWLPPNQPLSTYAYRTFATQAWANATLSVYPATVGAEQWIRLDNVTLRRTPSATITGTECLEPGAPAPLPAASPDPRHASAPASSLLVSSSPAPLDDAAEADADSTPAADATDATDADAFAPVGDGWETVATTTGRRVLTLDAPFDLSDATTATLTFDSWLTGFRSLAFVEVSVDGRVWAPVFIVAPSDTWLPVEVDVSTWVGGALHVRFVFDAIPPPPGLPPDVWRIERVRVER